MENTIECNLDNLVLYVEAVRMSGFEYFRKKLDEAETDGKIPPIRMTIGKGWSDYHYRLNIGQGGGAVTIGYKHNSVRHSEEFFTMRIEFNPAKNTKDYDTFWSIFGELFINHTKRIKQLDLAFDVPAEIRRIFAVSLTGRQRAYYKSTQYFGSAGNTGRLKIYDKKAELQEKQGVTIVDEHKTRIEYTFRFDEPITIQLFSKCNTTINTEYQIVLLNEEKLTGEIKAAVLGIHHGYMKMSEFTRTTKTKIKRALESMEQLDLDHAYHNARTKIIKKISSHLK